ncbi:5-deoxy-glucuronate isomerase [Microbacterium sp.]|uniref:5-deoxy-glucuronate isomerase n=1 Tax=Microbacterium sp. TaxID=51671 RepID=UPI0039E418C5
MTDTRWFHRRGALARDGWESVVDAATPGWEHTGIRVGVLAPGDELALDGTGVERIVVPLAGSFAVTHTEAGEAARTVLAGRASVFDGPTDVLYLSAAATATIAGTGRVAVATSPTTEVRPTRHLAAAETPVELRGAGASSRQVHNFGTPAALDAARLIVCEVITPAENWSSYPPHKHDEHVPGHESRLEEIYYFEAAPARVGGRADAAASAFGMFSTYSSPAGEIDIDAMVRTGDIALVPYGYHGPAVAAPGYDLYYLNVMAGPDPERVWLISDDPAHAWVRDTWAGQEFDDRLPYTAEGD